MNAVALLNSLGFAHVEALGERNGVQLVRIRTDKGWTYERFKTADDVTAWAAGKKPA